MNTYRPVGRLLRAGDLVRIKPLHEILATLDSEGSLDGLPFMAEMVSYCGRTFRVSKRAHKTCDTQYGIGGLRVVPPAVHLDDLRCDGSAHGDCQASCLLFWHTAWLTPVTEDVRSRPEPAEPSKGIVPAAWSRKADSSDSNGEPLYRCQATEAQHFTRPLPHYDLRQYLEDLTSGNVGFRQMFWSVFHAFFRKLMHIGIGYRFVVAVYDWVQTRRGAPRNPYVAGKLQSTPVTTLNLQPGECVRIKSFEEILATLDTRNRNRGLWFVPEEMGQYCGRTARVVRRVERFIDEKTGRMIVARTPSVILENVYCTGSNIAKRMNCPRASALFWREIWLERVSEAEALSQPFRPPPSKPGIGVSSGSRGAAAARSGCRSPFGCSSGPARARGCTGEVRVLFCPQLVTHATGRQHHVGVSDGLILADVAHETAADR